MVVWDGGFLYSEKGLKALVVLINELVLLYFLFWFAMLLVGGDYASSRGRTEDHYMHIGGGILSAKNWADTLQTQS